MRQSFDDSQAATEMAEMTTIWRGWRGPIAGSVAAAAPIWELPFFSSWAALKRQSSVRSIFPDLFSARVITGANTHRQEKYFDPFLQTCEKRRFKNQVLNWRWNHKNLRMELLQKALFNLPRAGGNQAPNPAERSRKSFRYSLSRFCRFWVPFLRTF